MKNLVLFSLLILLNILFCSCPDEELFEANLWVINDSDSTIYIFQEGSPYTLIERPTFEANYEDSIFRQIPAKDSTCYYYNNFPILTPYTLQYFVVRESTFNKYSLNEMKEYNIYDRRYVVPRDQIVINDGFKIVYDE